jgi:peptidyl-prolyl cis-trans isomerase D
MLSFFRRLSKSKVGTGIMAIILIAILAGFAIADISNFGSGKIGLGGSSGALATVGNQDVSDREASEAMQRRLQEARQQQPTADYASIIGDLPAIISALLDQSTMLAAADKYGFPLSKRMVDAEIAQLPNTKGLDGKFSEQAYQQFLAQQRLTDPQVRRILTGGLLQRLMLTPIATNARVPVGMATPYASLLLEAREGEAAIVPTELFKAGLKPTDAQVQQFYTANRARYAIPEQRALRIARIGPEQVAGVTATDKEISDYYNANKTTYAPSDTRSLSQVVVPDQATANAIAQRAKGGQALSAAAAPAGANAALTTLQDQSRAAYASVAGDKTAEAVFAASSGAIVGPVQSDFGWVVVKIDGVKAGGGKTIEQARTEIAAKLNADKRKAAMEDLVDKVQTALDDGSNFAEAVAAAKLPIVTTPLIAANGTSRVDGSYKAPPELAPVLKTGFEIAPNDPPEIVPLTGDSGYAVVSPGQVVPAAPAPLASIRERVAADWIADQANKKAEAVAKQIADRANAGASIADAVKAAGVALPPSRSIAARRIEISDQRGNVPPAMKVLFTVAAGKARMMANPGGGGYFIVKTNKIKPGNALSAPQLITQVQSELGDAAAQDYAEQFTAALRKEMGAKRNENAIAAFRTRLLTSGN